MFRKTIISGLIFGLTSLLSSFNAYAEQNSPILISQFATEQLKGWESKSFEGETRYTLTLLDQKTVLQAQSHASASGLFKKQHIDLQKTPYLNWRWRVDKALAKLNEQSKAGDDYAARIYVVVSGGLAFWKTRAINYVWSSHTDQGKTWPNAFVGANAMMMAIRTPADNTKQWYSEKRNVLTDLEQLFGEPIRYIDAVALMTDTDNSKGVASAYYSDVFFSAD